MSIKCLNWAFSINEGLTAVQKFMLVAICDRADDDGVCWPSYADLAKRCMTDRRVAMKRVKELCNMGFISKTSRFGGRGQTSNILRVNFSDVSNNAQHGADDGVRGYTAEPPEGYTAEPFMGYTAEPPRTTKVNHQCNSKKEHTSYVPKKGCRLKDELRANGDIPPMPAEYREAARKIGVDGSLLWENFYDYWLAQPGQKGVKLDWLATWRNWCRNDYGGKGKPKPQTSNTFHAL